MLKIKKIESFSLYFLLCIYLVILAPPAWADEFVDAFNSGVKSYQSKDWEKAITDFSQALKSEPNNIAALNNLAHTFYEKGQKGQAIALYRRVLFLHPDESTAKAGLKFALNHLEMKEIPHQIKTFEIIRENLLLPVGIEGYLLLTIFTFFAAAWMGLQYIGQKSQQADNPLSSRAVIASGFFAFLALLFTCLLGLKYWDIKTTRGTVIEPQVIASIAPGENQVESFTLYEGLEVIVRMQKDNWYQVTYPGGATGWIKKNALMITTDESI